jgi:ParB-like chromosome segregation protein Spo0J
MNAEPLELFTDNQSETNRLPELKRLILSISEMSLKDKVSAINQVKIALHAISPFRTEPVDCVLWVKNNSVHANEYNPNVVAPPEMELLRVSISEDGYTQPIVTCEDEGGKTREVIDGFHRNRVGKECADIQARVHGYLPVVTINDDRLDKSDRIAATIRHNRARGKHKVSAMSDIVIELKRRNWSDDKISKHLGMDADEILRLCQITGLAEMFQDQDFSKSWEIDEMEGELETLED